MGMSVKETEKLRGAEFDSAHKISKMTRNDDITHIRPNETQVTGWKHSQMSTT